MTARHFAPAAIATAFLALAACGNNCRPVEPLNVTLAGKSYMLVRAESARVVGANSGKPRDTANQISSTITGDGKDRHNTYCISDTNPPATTLIAFDGEDAAALAPRFAPLASLSQIAIHTGTIQPRFRPGGVPGPLAGMVRYDRKTGFQLEAAQIPGWPAPVTGHCGAASAVNDKRYCRIYAAFNPGSHLIIDLYSADIEAERWAEYFALARDLFVFIETNARLARQGATR